MYFDNTCKINNNGKISGYHQRGKYDGDKVIYFINDKFGDDEDLKLLKGEDKTNKTLKADKTAAPVGDKPAVVNHRAMNDQEIIKHCEEKTKYNKYLKRHHTIKQAIRERINNQLDERGYVDDNVLADFRFAVEHENQVGADVPESVIEIWKSLAAIYLI